MLFSFPYSSSLPRASHHTDAKGWRSLLKWWAHGNKFLSLSISAFWSSSLCFKGFPFSTETFYSLGFLTLSLRNFTHLSLHSLMTIPVLWSLPLSLSHSEPRICFTMNSSFAMNSLPLFRVHPPFEHPLCGLVYYSHSQKHLPECSEISVLTGSNFGALSGFYVWSVFWVLLRKVFPAHSCSLIVNWILTALWEPIYSSPFLTGNCIQIPTLLLISLFLTNDFSLTLKISDEWT